MPNTITDTITELADNKSDIQDALVAKGVTSAGKHGFNKFASDIASITNQYSSSDEGKVVSDGTLVAQTAMSTEITANDTYDTTLYNSVTVNVPQGGGSSVSKSDVNFYDYDGTVVASYTASEFAELTALPENPTHEGLTAQGWNWSLSDAKAYVASNGKLDVGQMYTTSDGKTRLYIRLGEGRLKPYLGLTGNSSGTAVSIDWGDNSSEEGVTLNSTTVYTSHEYVAAGDYVIAITVTNGSITFTGDTVNGSNIFRKSASPNSKFDKVYQNILTKLEIGSSVTSIGNSAFQKCSSLTSITMPSSITSIGNYAFNGCLSLASVTIPNGVTYIDSNAFSSCSSLTSVTIPKEATYIDSNAFSSCPSLTSVTIPNGITSIGNYAFNNCPSLTSVTIPNGITSIGSSAFNNCCGFGFIKFNSSTPPTVSNNNVWSNIPTDCIIYVPTGSLSAYTSADNYPSSSTYTYVEY